MAFDEVDNHGAIVAGAEGGIEIDDRIAGAGEAFGDGAWVARFD